MIVLMVFLSGLGSNSRLLQNSALQTETQFARIQRFCIALKKEIFFSKSAFRPHVSDGNKHRKHNFSSTLSKVQINYCCLYRPSVEEVKTEILENGEVISTLSRTG